MPTDRGEPANDVPINATPSSTPDPGDDKYHFYYSMDHPTQNRIIHVHLSAGFGRTPEQALKEILNTFIEHNHTQPVKEWNNAIKQDHLQVQYFKEDTDEPKLPFKNVTVPLNTE